MAGKRNRAVKLLNGWGGCRPHSRELRLVSGSGGSFGAVSRQQITKKVNRQ